MMITNCPDPHMSLSFVLMDSVIRFATMLCSVSSSYAFSTKASHQFTYGPSPCRGKKQVLRAVMSKRLSKMLEIKSKVQSQDPSQ